VWHETSPAVGKAKFPLVGDPTHTLTNAFGVHIAEEGLALRGTFVINPEGQIKTAESPQQRDRPRRVGTLRKLKAAQYTAANPARSARPSGRKAPRRWRRRSTWSARSEADSPQGRASGPPLSASVCRPRCPCARRGR
jgi:alkyl hydroperoxide reductase subunit AhpC